MRAIELNEFPLKDWLCQGRDINATLRVGNSSRVSFIDLFIFIYLFECL